MQPSFAITASSPRSLPHVQGFARLHRRWRAWRAAARGWRRPEVEIGGITEVAAGTPECPALLFDRIKGYAPGFRVFTNATTTPQRAALALGIDPSLRPLDALKAWMDETPDSEAAQARRS